MNIYKKVILIFTLFLLISCEKYYIASIVNNSKNKITVKIKIDNDAKEMEIYSGDTLILKCRKDQMKKLFSNDGPRSPGHLDLIIN